MHDDPAAIEKLHAEFGAAWSRGDSHAAAAFYAEDGIRVGARGDIEHGRAEIEAAYGRLFHGPFEGARVSMGSGSAATIRMLGPGYALWQSPFEITPAQGPPIRGYSVDVMVKTKGRWWILESHPKLFPPPAER